MAGGKGTRIASFANDIPKSMLPIINKPILEHQINCLTKNNLTDITIVIGHLGEQIKNYFGNGNRFNCNINYFIEQNPLGTAGALYKLKNLTNNFILINGDIIFDIDFSRMIAFHNRKKAQATLAVHPNNHPFDSSLIISDNDNQIINWINKEDERKYYRNQVNAGIHILSEDFLKNCHQNNEKVDLDRDILKPSIKNKRIFAYHTPEYIKDMGTPERYTQVLSDMEKGIIPKKNLKKKQKAVFLDRDGTINVLNGFIGKPDDFILIDGVAESIKTINMLGYLAIVVTNQPVIARGETDLETLNLIHMKMETDLGKCGAFIDGLFYCPHHPDKGFKNEIPEYKIECECRKPKPGMILKAAEMFNIDLGQSYMVGDHIRDVQAGINAGCKTVFLSSEKDKNEDISGYDVQIFSSLKEFTNVLN